MGFKSTLLESTLGKSNISKSLKLTSFSEQDMQQRIKAMDTAVENFEEMFRATNYDNDSQVSFAEGIGSANLRGTTFFDASITGLVTSIIPFFTIERGMEHISASLPYMDFYGIVKEDTKEVVSPNLGLKRSMDDGVLHVTSPVDAGSKKHEFSIGKPLTPGQVLISAGDFRIVDNSRGSLMAEAGLLEAGKVNYQEGTISLTFAKDLPEQVKEVTCQVAVDYVAKEQLDAITGEVKYYNARAAQMVVPVKRDIITDVSIKKMGVLNPDKLYAQAMLDQYHVRRNTLLAKNIMRGYRGNTLEIDLSKFTLQTSEYPAYINAFINMLEGLDQNIANRLGVVKHPTAYLVGKEVKYAFSTLASSKDWVPNEKATYVVGLEGWWKGRPVVYSDQLSDNEAYASCKTVDGNLAPLISGNFLPMSNLPTVGNYDNANKYSTGIYSMESLDLLTSELLQRFVVKLPAAFKLTPELI